MSPLFFQLLIMAHNYLSAINAKTFGMPLRHYGIIFIAGELGHVTTEAYT